MTMLDATPGIPDITFGADDHVHDLALHASRPLVSAALVDGSVHVLQYDADGNRPLLTLRHHADPCRSVVFGADGDSLYTASKDRSIAVVDLAAGAVVHQQPDAHRAPINIVHVYDANLLASGDDDGDLALWDLRADWRRPVLAWQRDENSDYISDMCAVPDRHALLVASADGTLGVWDVRRQGALIAMSDDVEDEVLSVVLIKNGKKVVCGSQDGVLMLFSYGDFGDMNDRFPGHPNSIDSIVAIDDDTICTASSDGMIRVVQIHPNKLLGVIGEYDFPVERIRLSHDRQWIASCSHDGAVKFWQAGFLFELDDDDDGGAAATTPMGSGSDSDADMVDSDADDEPAPSGGGGRRAPPPPPGFFADLD